MAGVDPTGDGAEQTATVRDASGERAVRDRHRRAAALADRFTVASSVDEIVSILVEALERAFDGSASVAPRIGSDPDPAEPTAESEPELTARVPAIGRRMRAGPRDWSVRVEFPAPRRVRPDEHLLLGLLTAAAGQALQRVAEAAARADQQRADQRFRSLVEASTAVVWTTDAAGEFIEPQRSWEAYTGQPWPEHAGAGWALMVHPDDRARVAAGWADAVATGAPLFQAYGRVWHAGSGGYRYFVARATGIPATDGTLAEWIGTLVDVHDQVCAEEAAKQAAAALSAARARYERLAATDVLAVFGGTEDLITEANAAFLSMLGYTVEDLQNGRLRWPLLTPPGWEAADARSLAELTSTGRSTAFAKEYLHRDGHRVPVLIGVVALDREPLRWLAYATDLTAERAAQSELRLFQALVERSADFVAVASPDGKVVYLNPAGRALVGLAGTDPVAGAELTDFAAPAVRESWRTEVIPRALRDGHIRAETRLARVETGEPIDVDHQMFTVTAGQEVGAAAFLAAVSRDITERQRSLRQAEALARFASALSTAQDRDAIVHAIATCAGPVLHAAEIQLALVNAGTGDIDVLATGSVTPGAAFDGDTPLARAVRENRTVSVGDDRAGVLWVPLRDADGSVLGALRVAWDGPAPVGDALDNLLDTVTGLCSQALQRAELIASTVAIADLAGRLSVTRSAREAIDVIVGHAPRALGARVPGLAVLEPDNRVRLWHDGLPDDMVASYADLTLDDPRPIAESLRTGERIIIPDRTAFQARYPGLADHAGMLGAITTVALPLLDSRRRPVAALGLGWSRARPFRTSDLALLDTIADLCEQTLERTRLVAAEHDLVERLARRLHTTPAATPPGLDIAVRYRPAMTGLNLGGDWYDLINLSGDRLAVVVGDVVGHGVEAAADMAQLRTIINTLIHLEVPLGEVFPRLTEVVGGGFLGTALAMIIDPAAGRVEVARAGHPNPILVPAGQPPVVVPTANSLPLGMVTTPMVVATAGFGVGDLLLGYTDGLVERRGRQYDDGVAELCRTVAAVAAEPVERIADTILDPPDGSGAPEAHYDDQALVVIRRIS